MSQRTPRPGFPRVLLPRREETPPPWLGRREFLRGLLAAGAGLAASTLLDVLPGPRGLGGLLPGPGAALAAGAPARREPVFVARGQSYAGDLKGTILDGLRELGLDQRLRGKSVLLKPNLVEPRRGVLHINTHPLVLRAAAEAFLSLGAGSVSVAEGSGNLRDPHYLLEESGLLEVLREDRIPFVDLNTAPWRAVGNPSRLSGLRGFALPEALLGADLVVSLAKMKTHHWAGVTLSMKNLFGALPGEVYGWPKNVLHFAGIQACAVDVSAALAPGLAIVDGVVGMEGDGPILGEPVASGLLVLARRAATADAACCALMGVRARRVWHLMAAEALGLGLLEPERMEARGEAIALSGRPYLLRPDIEAQAALLDKG